MSKLPRTFRHVSTRGQQPVHGMARRPAPSRARDYDRFSSGADPRKSKVRDSLPHYEEPRVQKVLMHWRCRGETRRSWWMTSRLCSLEHKIDGAGQFDGQDGVGLEFVARHSRFQSLGQGPDAEVI